jgi:hypothetical protein
LTQREGGKGGREGGREGGTYLFLARLGMSREDSLHLRKSILKTLICCPRVRRKDMGTPVTRAISM